MFSIRTARTLFALVLLPLTAPAAQAQGKVSIRNPTGQKVVSGNPESAPSPVFTFVERRPEAPYDLQKYLTANLRYPPEALKEGISGRVVIKFVIDETGRITDPFIERSVSKELDAEALRVVSAMPDWKPGRQNGKPVAVYYRVPVMFAIP